jgi:hypothetical protein
MKTVINLENGALTITEKSGDFYLNLNGSLGGGTIAGIVSGQASIKLGTGTVGLKAGEAFINHLIPSAGQPVAQMIESAINSYVAGL